MKGLWMATLAGVAVAFGAIAQPGDVDRGQRDFRPVQRAICLNPVAT